MEWLMTVLAWVGVALLFSLAVFIHELGHFLAARWMGLHVDTFSIGFGPALWKKKIGGVEYRIGAIPFGGYVALPQLDPSGMEKVQGNQEQAANRKDPLPEVAPWRRMVVAFAGPLGNVVLAVLLACVIWVAPGVKTGVVTTRVGIVMKESPAWKGGLRDGDQVISVNGVNVATWTDLQTECLLAGMNAEAKFQIRKKADGSLQEMALPLSTNNVMGIAFLEGVLPELLCVVGEVVPDSPAMAAGLRTNDVILAVNGMPVTSSHQFIGTVQKIGANKPMDLLLRRDEKQVKVSLQAQYDPKEKRPLVGVRIMSMMDSVKPWMMYKSAWGQLKWDALSVVRVLQGLVHPKSKGERAAIAKNVGGPVAIMVGLYRTVRGSWWDAWGFLRMICINLAILNLLPIPVLDGGHILFALYEMITRRKPHPRLVAWLVNTFAIMLLGLMALLVYRDIARQVKMAKPEDHAAETSK